MDKDIDILLKALKEISKPTYGTEWITCSLEEYKSNYDIIMRHFLSHQQIARDAVKEYESKKKYE